MNPMARSATVSCSGSGDRPGTPFSRVHIGTRLAVFWPDDGVHYAGVIAERHPEYDRNGGAHHVTIHYDDGEKETVDLALETFRVLESDNIEPQLEAPSPRGNRKRHVDPPWAFLLDGYEIYWGDRGGWRLYSPYDNKVSFYSCSFATGRCEVELNDEGTIYDTHFRKLDNRKRKRASRASLPSHAERPPTPKARITAEIEVNSALGPDPSQPHYITDKLRMTRKEVISSLPKEMVMRFGDCCWVLWKGVARPVLILSPFDISGEGGMVEEWANAHLSCQKRGTPSKMPHLVYWYETVSTRYARGNAQTKVSVLTYYGQLFVLAHRDGRPAKA